MLASLSVRSQRDQYASFVSCCSQSLKKPPGVPGVRFGMADSGSHQ